MKNALIGSVAAAVAAFGMANAAILDLTAAGALTDAGPDTKTAMAGGEIFTIVGSPEAVNNSEAFDGTGTEPFCSANGGSFACDTDGIGISDDEFSGNGSQTASVSIDSKAFALSTVYLLDLFTSPDGSETETAVLSISRYNGLTVDVDITALLNKASNPSGWLAVDLSGLGLDDVTEIVFSASTKNGTDDGNSDFALAGIEFDDVFQTPVPAAALLFGTALAAGAAARRKRQA